VNGAAPPSACRADDARLARLLLAATWICSAAGLGLLGSLPAPGHWAGAAGLALLLVLAPFARGLRWPALQRAPAPIAALGLAAGWSGLLEPSTAVACMLALLLATETIASGEGHSGRRVALLTLLSALLACTLTTSPLLAPLLLLAGAGAAGSLLLETLGHDGEAATRSVVISAPPRALGFLALLVALAVLSALCFLALPRHPARQAQVPVPTHRLVGYSEQVRLGELAEALADPTPLFRVRIEDREGASVPGPFHFRGVVLDSFDGTTWTARAPHGEALPTVDGAGGPLAQHFRFEPTAPPILVGVPRLRGISIPPEDLQLHGSGTMLHRGGPRVHGYQVWSTPDSWRIDPSAPLDPTLTTAPDGLYLALPPQLDPEIRALAARVTTAGQDEAERALALVEHLGSAYDYERRPTAPLGAQPLSAFLLDHQRGHCELFATALAVLLRIEGIPSRVVNGFYGGVWNPVGRYWLVRHADAHAWVEAWLPGRGWVSLDPTPSPERRSAGLAQAAVDHASTQWTHRVLSLDGPAQLEALSTPGAQLRRLLRSGPDTPSLEAPSRLLDLLLSGLMVTALAVAALMAWRRLAPWLAGERLAPPPATGEVERCLRAGLRLLHRRGWHPPAHLPPLAAARWATRRAGPGAAPFEAIAELHYRVRYGGQDDHELAGPARAALQALRALGGPAELP
jgi:transglutaminase-like putative cysteine protease